MGTPVLAALFEQFRSFWSLNDPNVVWVLSGSLLLGASAGVIGCFAFLRKRSLTGDALAHAALPGVTTAFILFNSREPAVILSGAIVSCLVGYLVIEYLVNHTKVKEDSAFAIVLSLFFAFGIFQLTYIQKSAAAGQSGLDKLLFGQAAALLREDVQLLGAIALLVLSFILLCYRPLKIISFDRSFASTAGINVARYELLLALALVLSVVIGLQLVGVVLMAAILLTPAAAARYWSNDLRKVIVLAGIFGALSGAVGANISYLAPGMPTGPWMVVSVTAFFFLSLLFAPERGVIARVRRRIRFARKINDENLLRTLYKIGEKRGDRLPLFEPAEIQTYRNMDIRELERAVRRLKACGYITETAGLYRLTPEGFQRAERVTTLHRLWELYLTQRIHLSPDHVHEDAEEVEHILTPELEERLRAELDSPRVDPHGQSIPKGE